MEKEWKPVWYIGVYTGFIRMYRGYRGYNRGYMYIYIYRYINGDPKPEPSVSQHLGLRTLTPEFQ